ncbi:hypothetical protein [Vibrio casei]|uniref:hypothetical protein n=1 Tax=Vibrio casei TaxID=673372 RepID=UPI003F9B54F2
MKAWISLSITLLMLTAASVQAETIWNMKIGSDYWWTTNKVDEIKYQGDNSISAYIDVSHSLPYVPNFKIRYTQIDNDSMNFNNIDYITYYSVLHTNRIALNVGLSVSQFQGGNYKEIGMGNGQKFNELE